jgi:prolyl-tRNA synthetase
MRYSKIFIPTLKEDPANSHILSHRFMLRSGMIRQLASGVYTYLPFGLRVLKNISKIIKYEFDKIGAQEFQMPILQPIELWNKSDRLYRYGLELFRLKDRKNKEFCLGPTHEEVITNLISNNIHSYKELPLLLYQVQTKFRDEIRPKFGLMRGREFLMKDAYSFSENESCAKNFYKIITKVYEKIFVKCGLEFLSIKADTGNIGGTLSHEFHAISNINEGNIVMCENCSYADKINLVPIFYNNNIKNSIKDTELLQKLYTPNKNGILEVSKYLGVNISRFIKSLTYIIDKHPCMILLRGDHQINEYKLKNMLNAQECRVMSRKEIEYFFGSQKSLSPIDVPSDIKIISDLSLKYTTGLISAGSEINTYLSNILIGRDFDSQFFDLRRVSNSDLCVKCYSRYVIKHGIEIGHIFYLGTRYSKPMNAAFFNKNGKKKYIEMGCYGLGIGRIASAIIEQNYKNNIMIWPTVLAPFLISLISLDTTKLVLNISETLYIKLKLYGLKVLFDDRNERSGIKFNDQDLLGSPIRILVGSRNLNKGKVEICWFHKSKKNIVTLDVKEVLRFLDKIIKTVFCIKTLKMQ